MKDVNNACCSRSSITKLAMTAYIGEHMAVLGICWKKVLFYLKFVVLFDKQKPKRSTMSQTGMASCDVSSLESL